MLDESTPLTPEDVDARIAEIVTLRDDDEVAHSEEDALHRDVLRAIAEGSSVPRELAARALRTADIDFHRWCA